MASKGVSTRDTAAAVRRTAITACRGSLQALHNAANLVNSYDKEAARMLRTGEAMARSAVARLEFLGREMTNKKKGMEKEDKDTDAPMGPTAAAAAAAPKPRRRRGRRGDRTAAPPLAAAEPVLQPDVAADARARPAGRVLQKQFSRERSPRRDPTPTSSSAASLPCELGGFRVGQTVCFCGLIARPELIGSLATVVSFDQVAGRIAVKVDSTE